MEFRTCKSRENSRILYNLGAKFKGKKSKTRLNEETYRCIIILQSSHIETIKAKLGHCYLILTPKGLVVYLNKV